MDEATSILSYRIAGDKEAFYRNFYNALSGTIPHGKLIKEHGLTLEEMTEISQSLRNAGYGWERYFYLPVYAFYRIKTFQYILEHREELRRRKGHEAFTEAALGLKRYFRTWV